MKETSAGNCKSSSFCHVKYQFNYATPGLSILWCQFIESQCFALVNTLTHLIFLVIDRATFFFLGYSCVFLVADVSSSVQPDFEILSRLIMKQFMGTERPWLSKPMSEFGDNRIY